MLIWYLGCSRFKPCLVICGNTGKETPFKLLQFLLLVTGEFKATVIFHKMSKK